jgi:hypothetical protein
MAEPHRIAGLPADENLQELALAHRGVHRQRARDARERCRRRTGIEDDRVCRPHPRAGSEGRSADSGDDRGAQGHEPARVAHVDRIRSVLAVAARRRPVRAVLAEDFRAEELEERGASRTAVDQGGSSKGVLPWNALAWTCTRESTTSSARAMNGSVKPAH